MAGQAINPCPRCGANLTGGSPRGLCAACLMRRYAGPPSGDGLDAQDPGDGTSAIRLGDYELMEVIGRGGMGVVYRARQISANRMVAVKLIAAGDFASPDLIRRFRSEAETAAALEHPGIVPVYEVGEVDGRHFFSMRLVPGRSLASRMMTIRRGTEPGFTPVQIARMVESMARAVQFAHERGVLHRDIKPGNIMIDDRGEAVLMDFGLAKWISQDSAHTRTQAALGTPAYMAPEQAAGRVRDLTTAVDVYGLGTVLYELLTGHEPFRGNSSYEVIRQVIEADPKAPSEWVDGVDKDLETICLKCLHKQPQQRYDSAAFLAGDLERWRTHRPISARSPGVMERAGKWIRRHPALAAAMVAVAAGLVLNVVAQRRHASALRTERDTALQAQQTAEHTVLNQRLAYADQLLERGKTAEALAEWSRVLRLDPTNPIAAGRAFSTLSHRNFVLPQSKEAVPIPGFSLEFSPDGHRAIHSSKTHTRLLDGATLRPGPDSIMIECQSSRVAWDATGKRLAIVDVTGEGVTIHDADSLQPLFPGMPIKNWAVPVFSKDGKHLAVSGGENSDIWMVDAVTGRGSRWTGDRRGNRRMGTAADPEGLNFLIPTPDGIETWRMDGGEGPLTTVKVERSIRRVRTRPQVPLAILESSERETRFVDPGTLKDAWPAIALQNVTDDDLRADGMQYVSAQPERWGQIWDLATGKPLGEPALRASSPCRVRYTPDGRGLVLFGDDEGLHICDARDGKIRSWPCFHQGIVTHAEFSSDGRRIVTSSEDGTAVIWDASSGRRIGSAMTHEKPVRSARFFVSGTRILTLDAGNELNLWDASTGQRTGGPWMGTSFVHAAEMDPVGRWIACGTAEGWTLYSTTQEGPAPVFSDTSGKTPCVQFSADGQSLLTLTVTDLEKDLVRLWTPGESTPRWTLPEAAPYTRAAMTDDARRIAIAGGNAVVRIFDVIQGRWIGSPMRHKGEIWVVAFSRDGRTILTAGYDKKAQVWDSESGAAISIPMLHDAGVWQAQLSHDGSRVLTSTSEGVARVWDARTGHALTEPLHEHSVAVHIIMSPSTPMRFSPDGTRVVLPCDDQAARVIDLPPASPPAGWLPDMMEAIAGQRWGTNGVEILRWDSLYAARSTLPGRVGDDDWSQWARWFFADRGDRNISFRSNQTMDEYVGALLAAGTRDALLDVLRVKPGHRQARHQLAREMGRHPDPRYPGQPAIIGHLLR